MQCPSCQSENARKYGHTSDQRPRFRCRECRRVWVETTLPKPARRARRLPVERVEMILGMLCEGMSLRAIQRLVGVEQRTILRLLLDLGEGCSRLLEEKLRAVKVEDVEIDELFTYIVCKEATKKRKKIDNPEAGDSYLFLGIERHSKILLAHHVGRRTSADANVFMARLARATVGRFALHSDGFDGFPGAVEEHLGGRVDYGQIVKEFGTIGGEEARRYAPPRLIGLKKYWISGTPEEERIGTSRIERVNWTVRTGLRRYVRLSNGFSRKKENLAAAVAIFVCYYNFVKFHKSIRMTPAMKADIVRVPWSIADLLREAEARRIALPIAA
jgi:transposase-like protein/IS1 family transposase